MRFCQIGVQPINIEKNNKPFRVLKACYKIIHVLSAFDFGFFECKTFKQRLLLKVTTILHSLFMIALTLILMEQDDMAFVYWIIYYLSHYFLQVLIISSLSPNKTFCQLQHDLYSVDAKLCVDSASYRVEIKNLTCVSLISLSRIIIYTHYCLNHEDCVNPILAKLIFLHLMVSVNIVQTCCAFVFYSINCRLKLFTSIMETEKRDITEMQIIFKTIADLAECHKSALDPLFLISVIFSTFEVMATILYCVLEMKRENSLELRSEFLTVVTSLVQMFAPALCADYLCTQKNKLIIILHENMIQERDESRLAEIEQFIRYAEARDLRFRVYKLIPLDASLLTMVLSFAVTYLIVIVQFL